MNALQTTGIRLGSIVLSVVLILISAKGFAENRIEISNISDEKNISKRLQVYMAENSDPVQPDPDASVDRILELSNEEWLLSTRKATASRFKPKGIWFSGTLSNSAQERVERTLLIEPWRMGKAWLYLIDPESNQITDRFQSIDMQRAANAESWSPLVFTPHFNLSLEAGESRRFLLFLSSKTFPKVDLYITEKKKYEIALVKKYFMLVALFGFSVFLFVNFALQKNLGSSAISLWLVLAQIVEYSYHYPILYLLSPMQLLNAIQNIQILYGLTSITMLVAVIINTDLYRFKSIRYLFGIAIAIFLISIFGVVLGVDQNITRPVIGYSTLASYLLVPLAIGLKYKQINRVSKKMILMINLFWLLLLWRALVASGLTFGNLYNTDFPIFYLAAGTLLVLMISKNHNDQLKTRQKYRENKLAQFAEEANQKLIQFKIKENERLKQIVAEKTAKLTEERDRAEQESHNKSLFLSSASHELRSPLHDIIGLAELIKNSSQPCNDHNIQAILSSSELLLGMINDILQCSRGEFNVTEVKPETASLVSLAQALSSRYRIKCEKTDLQFRLDLSECRQEWVKVDRVVLVKVLRNLLDNACKYTEQGEIELSVATFVVDQNPDQVRVRFSVSDTGIGISIEDQRKIFDPYYRVNHHKPGIGLGLTIVCQILKAMDSDLQVISRPDKVPGSLFTFDLILDTSCEPSEAGSAEVDLPIGYLGAPINLLVCDDNLSHQAILAGTLRQLGFTVSEFSDVRPTVESLITRRTPLPDLIISDQHMAHESGWSLLQFCKEDRDLQSIPFIMISAGILQRPSGVPHSIQVNGFMMKPFTQQELIKELTRTLNIRWRYAEHSEGSNAQDASIEEALSYPESLLNEQDTFHRLVKNGQLLQLEEWSKQMLELHPEERCFLMKIIGLCKEIDLQSLRKLIKPPQAN